MRLFNKKIIKLIKIEWVQTLDFINTNYKFLKKIVLTNKQTNKQTNYTFHMECLLLMPY